MDKELKTKWNSIYGQSVSKAVTLTKEDLEQAFKSERDLQILLHNVCLEAYGLHTANRLFPIESEDSEC